MTRVTEWAERDDVQCTDASFTQRRNAHASISLMMSAVLHFVYDAVVLTREETELPASKLEAEAMKQLMANFLATLSSTDTGATSWWPKWIALDEHLENHAYISGELYTFLKQERFSEEVEVVREWSCGRSKEQCFRDYEESRSHLCSAHGKELGSIDRMYEVRRGSDIETVSSTRILEATLKGKLEFYAGDTVTVLKDPLKSIRVALDLWHKAKNLTNRLEENLARQRRRADLQLNKAELLDMAKQHFLQVVDEGGELMLANWLRFTGDLGSVAQRGDRHDSVRETQLFQPESIVVLDRWIVGGDEHLAGLIDSMRLKQECSFADCTCLNRLSIDDLVQALGGSSGRCPCRKLCTEDFDNDLWSPLQGYKQQLEKLSREQRRKKYTFIDASKFKKLRCKHAQSSICESCYAFLHKVLHKFRWFRKTLRGRIHYLLLTWNIMCFKQLTALIRSDGEFRSTREVERLKEEDKEKALRFQNILSNQEVVGVSMEQIREVLSLRQIQKRLVADLRCIVPHEDSILYDGLYFVNSYRGTATEEPGVCEDDTVSNVDDEEDELDVEPLDDDMYDHWYDEEP